MTYQTEVAADSPRLYYKLDQSAVNSGAASSANLTAGGSITYDSNGIGTTYSAVLNGTAAGSFSASVMSRTEFADVASGRTWEFWIKTTSGAKTVAKWGASAGTTHWKIQTNSSGQIGMYWKNGDFNVFSSASINDGNWHHVVITLTTSGGNAMKIYIDGVLDSTPSISLAGIQSGSTANFYLGSDGNDAIVGNIDEFAIYNGVLSATRVGVHYGQGLGTPVDVTVTTPTLSLATIDATPNYGVTLTQTVPDIALVQPAFTVSAGTKFDALTGAVSLVSTDATVETETVITTTQQSSVDGRYNITSHEYDQDSNTTIVTSGDNAMIMQFSYPVGGVDTLKNARIHMARNANSGDDGATSYRVWAITAPWTASGSPDLTLSSPMDVSAENLDNLDINSLITDDDFYGVVLQKIGSGSSTWRAREFGDTSTPAITYVYSYSPEGATVDVETASLSLAVNDVTVRTDSILDQAAGNLTLAGVDATVETTDSPNTTVDVVTPTMSLNSGDISVIVNTEITLTTPVISLANFDATNEVTTNSDVELETGRLSIVGLRPSEVNGEPVGESEDDDVYYTQTRARNPLIWYRGNASTVIGSNTYIPNRGSVPNTYDGLVNGVSVGNKNGLEARATMNFDGGDFIREQEPNPDELTYGTRTLEFTMRTNKPNEYLMGGQDNYGQGLTVSGQTGFVDFFLVDGKIQQRRNGEVTVTGYKNIADGAWHHIVITSKSDDQVTPGGRGYLEVWIDGQLDVRRRSGQGQPEYTTWGFPDYIGGRSGEGTENGVSRDVPQSNWFVGDMTEIVYYTYLLNEDQILAQRDAAFAVVPIRVETGHLTIKSNEAVVKSNKTRMLWIDFSQGNGFSTFPNDINLQRWRSSAKTGKGVASLVIDGGALPYLHFLLPGTNYMDEKLDEIRLIDLTKDIDMNDYDAIGFIGYPENSDQKAQLIYSADPDNNGLKGQQRFDALIKQLKDQVVAGKSMLITNPLLAVDLDLVGNYEYNPSMTEYVGPRRGEISGFRGAANLETGYDGWSALINPFQTDPTLGPDAAVFVKEPKAVQGLAREVAGEFYWDTHRNDKYRIRNLVPGLTDQPSYIEIDQIQYLEPVEWPDQYTARKYANRMPQGLLVGDEFYYRDAIPSGLDARSTVGKGGGYGVRLDAVKSGTVVATWSDKIGQGTAMVDNPYKNFATVIAVEPGDYLTDGRQVAGKVFIDIGETPNYELGGGYTSPKQIVPTNAEQMSMPENQRHLENDEQRAWDLSIWRGGFASYEVINYSYDLFNPNNREYKLNADGTLTYTVGQGGGGRASILYKAAYQGWWQIIDLPFDTMLGRGFKWLSKSVELNGTALVGVDAAKMTLKANDVTVETTASPEVYVETARLVMESYEEADAPTGDSTVHVPTPTMSLDTGKFQQIVDVETGRITLTAYEDIGSVIDESEVIGLTLFGYRAPIMLSLKEES
jgi:hypothetical protein